MFILKQIMKHRSWEAFLLRVIIINSKHNTVCICIIHTMLTGAGQKVHSACHMMFWKNLNELSDQPNIICCTTHPFSLNIYTHICIIKYMKSCFHDSLEYIRKTASTLYDLRRWFQCVMFAFFKHPSCPLWSNCRVWLSSPLSCSRISRTGKPDCKAVGTVSRSRAQPSEWESYRLHYELNVWA